MCTAGKIIFFDPFYFKNGNSSKPKYFLVIKVVENNVVLACLPSSIAHLPRDLVVSHGCVEIPDACINCYIFEPNQPVTTNGWGFPKWTMLYGNWLDDFPLDKLKENYPIEGVDYEIIGELTIEELKNVTNCFATSSVVKRKYKKWLLRP
ncbi:MAG TPA: hypothetical protein VK616_05215 [Flavitalea sp.]|nr:hypothetical protein [Flavitalea sp.]